MKIIKKIRYNLALAKVKRLEQERQFISPFFCGDTAYPIELEKNEKALKLAKAKLRSKA